MEDEDILNTPKEVVEHLPEWQQILIKMLREHRENWSRMTEREKRKYYEDLMGYHLKKAEEIKEKLDSDIPVDEWKWEESTK